MTMMKLMMTMTLMTLMTLMTSQGRSKSSRRWGWDASHDGDDFDDNNEASQGMSKSSTRWGWRRSRRSRPSESRLNSLQSLLTPESEMIFMIDWIAGNEDDEGNDIGDWWSHQSLLTSNVSELEQNVLKPYPLESAFDQHVLWGRWGRWCCRSLCKEHLQPGHDELWVSK